MCACAVKVLTVLLLVLSPHCSDVGKMLPALLLLDMFGVVQSGHLAALKKEMPQVSINSRPFSTISRPTPASKVSERTMWDRKCRLRFKV